MISPLAYVSPNAQVAESCEIGPFCYIDDNVIIGEGNVLMNSVTVLSGTRIGKKNHFFPGAVIGAIPQDLKFQGEETTAEIGDGNTFRENVTMNRGTAARGKTVVGSHNLFMESMHIAHDVSIGSGCIIGNGTKIAGEVVIDDSAIISANCLFHQFCRVGSHVMVGGGSRTSQDIPPYVLCAREPIAMVGLNLVGLRRRGFSPQLIENIHNAYRIIYQKDKLRDERFAQVREEIPHSKEIDYILDFVHSSKRGIVQPQ
ncbi:MAG: acyl-ACP--UDP-N-acetylglucosamine O-acyltransferase [Bacteroidaceae bacterium]|nr:acyl-ACP--UDP-N-acetylglucosamine O-acyltransferase [Bacteroidaceae bacterium]